MAGGFGASAEWVRGLDVVGAEGWKKGGSEGWGRDKGEAVGRGQF